MWALLDILTRAELLGDVDANASQKALDTALGHLPPWSTNRQVQEAALQADTRVKKGAGTIKSFYFFFSPFSYCCFY